jgi:hypothetical protein
MDAETIGMIMAIIGVVATIGWFVLGGTAIKLLKDIRDNNNNESTPSES